MRAVSLTYAVLWLQAAFRLQKISQPKEKAISIVAKRNKISTSTLRTILKRDLADAPHLKPGPHAVREVEVWVKDHIDRGLAHLHPRKGIELVPQSHKLDSNVQRYRAEKARRQRTP